MINPKPFKPPQIKNSQLLPCHKPPSNMVTIKLIFVLMFCFTEGKAKARNTSNKKNPARKNNNHNFPLNNTMNKEMITMHTYEPIVPERFPPRGMYKYSCNQLDKEICQRFQNSLVLSAL